MQNSSMSRIYCYKCPNFIKIDSVDNTKADMYNNSYLTIREITV